MQNADEKIDAYVLVRDTQATELRDLFKATSTAGVTIRAKTRLVGRYDALFVLEGDSIRDIQDFVIETIHGNARVGSDTLTRILPTPLGIKRTSWVRNEVCAYVRVKARKGHTIEVQQKIAAIDAVTGLAIVVGSTDLLVEIAGPDITALRAAILQLQDIAGIRATETLLAAPNAEDGP